jgi:hypothetical protein
MAKKVEVTEVKKEAPELKAVANGDDVLMNLKDKKNTGFRGLRKGEKSA